MGVLAIVVVAVFSGEVAFSPGAGVCPNRGAERAQEMMNKPIDLFIVKPPADQVYKRKGDEA
jgi:hypothetical protein